MKLPGKVEIIPKHKVEMVSGPPAKATSGPPTMNGQPITVITPNEEPKEFKGTYLPPDPKTMKTDSEKNALRAIEKGLVIGDELEALINHVSYDDAVKVANSIRIILRNLAEIGTIAQLPWTAIEGIGNAAKNVVAIPKTSTPTNPMWSSDYLGEGE